MVGLVYLFIIIMICSWNVRGAGKKGFDKIISDIRKVGHIEVFAILEPRVSGAKAAKIVERLGFNNKYIVEASSFSGGIWLLWNDNKVSLQVVASSKHSITVLMAEGNIF